MVASFDHHDQNHFKIKFKLWMKFSMKGLLALADPTLESGLKYMSYMNFQKSILFHWPGPDNDHGSLILLF